MVDPLPVPVRLTGTKRPGRPKGGQPGKRKNKRPSSVKKKVVQPDMEQAVFVDEPTEAYDMLNSSDRSASYNTGVTAEDETSNLVEDESDSEIEHYGDEDEDEDDADAAENIDDLAEFVEERNEPLFETDIVQRLAIGYMFFKKFGAVHNHQEWRDKNIRPQIRKAFNLSKNHRIDHILSDVVACKKAGITYTGTRKIGAHTTMGKPPILATDSIEAQIIADCLVSGWSPLSLSQWMVNQHRKEAQEESLTLAPIRHLMKRLKPVVRKVKKQAQGSKDPTSKWARARVNFNTQVLRHRRNSRRTFSEILQTDLKFHGIRNSYAFVVRVPFFVFD
jgi:hypothetical protein